LVYVAAMQKGAEPAVTKHEFGAIGRDKVRAATVEKAIEALIELAS